MMKRLFVGLALCLLGVVHAAVETTTVNGKIVTPDGVVVTSGKIAAFLSDPGTTPDTGTAESQRVSAKASGTVAATGDVSITLVPNDAITPSGTYYTVRFTIRQPIRASWVERWSVTTSPDPIDIGDVTRLDVAPGITVGNFVRYVDTEPTGSCTSADTPRITTDTDAWCKCVSDSWSCEVITGGGGGGSSTLGGLTDVDETGADLGEALVSDGDGTWSPSAATVCLSDGTNCQDATGSAASTEVLFDNAGAVDGFGSWTAGTSTLGVTNLDVATQLDAARLTFGEFDQLTDVAADNVMIARSVAGADFAGNGNLVLRPRSDAASGIEFYTNSPAVRLMLMEGDGDIQLPLLTANRCLRINSSNVITAASGDCASGDTTGTDTLDDLSDDNVDALADVAATCSAAADQICVGDGTDFEGRTLPDCDLTTQKLQYDQATDAFTCGTDQTGGGGSSIVLDLADDGTDESSGVTEIATTGDTNAIFSEPSADKLLIAVGNDWPKADDADDVTCSGCVADSELANDYISEVELDSEAELEAQLVGVTDVFTNNDGALADDNLGDDNVDALADVAATCSAAADQICVGDGTDFEGRTLPDCDLTTQKLQYDQATDAFTCGTDQTGGGGSSIVLDLADDGTDESSGVTEIATTGDTNAIFSEPSADKLLIAVGNDWPKADDADDVTCSGCVADSELANDYISEVELDSEAELEAQLVGVTDVFTNNDGALDDDNLGDDAITALSDVSAKTGTGTTVVFGTSPTISTGLTVSGDVDANGWTSSGEEMADFDSVVLSPTAWWGFDNASGATPTIELGTSLGSTATTVNLRFDSKGSGAFIELEADVARSTGEFRQEGNRLQIGDADAVTNATCLTQSSDRLFHDTDCDETKDAGEEWIDQAGGGGSSEFTDNGDDLIPADTGDLWLRVSGDTTTDATPPALGMVAANALEFDFDGDETSDATLDANGLEVDCTPATDECKLEITEETADPSCTTGDHWIANVNDQWRKCNNGTITNLEDGETLTDDTVLVANGTAWQNLTLPDCDNATTSKLLYDQATNAFSCGTDQTGGGGGGSGITVEDAEVSLQTVTNTVTETAVFSYEIPADDPGTDGLYCFELGLRYLNDSGATESPFLRVEYGGSTLWGDPLPNLSTNANERALYLRGCMAFHSASSQHAHGFFYVNDAGGASAGNGNIGDDEVAGHGAWYGSGTVDSTSAQTFEVTIQHDNANASVTLTKDFGYMTKVN